MTVSQVRSWLLKCIVIGLGIMVYSMVMLLFFSDIVFSIHQQIFDISREQFNGIIYGVMAAFKMAWLIVFVIPYLAIMWHEKDR